MLKKRGRTYRKRKKNEQDRSRIETYETYYLLLKWMSNFGHKPAKKLRPKCFAGSGKGLMAEETVYSGDVIISIPEKLLITPQMILHSDLGDIFKKYCPEASGHQILSVFLMCEKKKNEASEWFPYIRTLPPTFSIPVYFSDHLLSILPESIHTQAVNQRESVRTSYAQLNSLLQNLEMIYPIFKNILNFELYKWAWCNVNTRCIYVNKADQDDFDKAQSLQIALAPYLDLLNHSVHAKVSTYFNTEKRKFEIISQCNFKKYSQVFINYGCHGNRKLFIEYGFVVPGNYNDNVPFSRDDIVSAYKECKFSLQSLSGKLKFVQENNLLRNLTCSCDGLSWNLIIIFRILSANYDIKEWKAILYENNKLEDDANTNLEKLKKNLLLLKLDEYNLMESACTDCAFECCSNHQLISNLLSIERRLLLKAL